MIDKYELFGQGQRLWCPHCSAQSITVEIRHHPTSEIYGIRLYCYGCLTYAIIEVSAMLFHYEEHGKLAIEKILMSMLDEFDRYTPQALTLSPDDSIDKYWAEVSATD